MRKSRGSISKNINVFIGKNSVFRRYCIQSAKDGIQIHVYNVINDSVNHSSQFISVKVKKNLRKSQAKVKKIEAQAK